VGAKVKIGNHEFRRAVLFADVSIDAKVYVWHKENGRLVETLEGHRACVNCVAWSPTNPFMFASASDDKVVRM
jgi:WD repeat-containing protein 26